MASYTVVKSTVFEKMTAEEHPYQIILAYPWLIYLWFK